MRLEFIQGLGRQIIVTLAFVYAAGEHSTSSTGVAWFGQAGTFGGATPTPCSII